MEAAKMAIKVRCLRKRGFRWRKGSRLMKMATAGIDRTKDFPTPGMATFFSALPCALRYRAHA
ncbi:hypothetical protein TPL01_05620 [Sulfuriferula plumbiphila]|uniref:Uncharacterized protein n=1 Tax=Sulfuriferula plumbiphila TaxID=171865 RepID=A0A512L4P0_9PROT|nr:hypothetical protein SFPGR_11690 [Sulfuriferula plumbiphila]GEP29424.1 hypothetical protein TPL01_05620 [Sulfuriferula plumbiphila]